MPYKIKSECRLITNCRILTLHVHYSVHYRNVLL